MFEDGKGKRFQKVAEYEAAEGTEMPEEGAITSVAVGLNVPPPKMRQIANWSLYTVAELVRASDQIRRQLPPLELRELHLEEEMLMQYHALRELQGDVLSDEEVPVNQRAQVANAVAANLKTLGDLQIKLYSSERFKDVENALIRWLSTMPEEEAAPLIDSYTKLLKKHKE